MICEFVVYQDPTGCLMAFRFSPFEVRDDSNPSGDGLSHLSRAKLGGAATPISRLRLSKLFLSHGRSRFGGWIFLDLSQRLSVVMNFYSWPSVSSPSGQKQNQSGRLPQ